MNNSRKDRYLERCEAVDAAMQRVQDLNKAIAERMRRYAKEGTLYTKTQRLADSDALKEAEEQVRRVLESFDEIENDSEIHALSLNEFDSVISGVCQKLSLRKDASTVLRTLLLRSHPFLPDVASSIPTRDLLNDLGIDKPTYTQLRMAFDELESAKTLQGADASSQITFKLFATLDWSADSLSVRYTFSGLFLHLIQRLGNLR